MRLRPAALASLRLNERGRPRERVKNVVLLLAPLHYIVLAITGKANQELREMTLRAVHYLVELLVFVTGSGDDKPFPLGPFPKV